MRVFQKRMLSFAQNIGQCLLWEKNNMSSAMKADFLGDAAFLYHLSYTLVY